MSQIFAKYDMKKDVLIKHGLYGSSARIREVVQTEKMVNKRGESDNGRPRQKERGVRE